MYSVRALIHRSEMASAMISVRQERKRNQACFMTFYYSSWRFVNSCESVKVEQESIQQSAPKNKEKLPQCLELLFVCCKMNKGDKCFLRCFLFTVILCINAYVQLVLTNSGENESFYQKMKAYTS